MWRIFILVAFTAPAFGSQAPLKVMVSVAPLMYFTERVGGPRVEVRSMVKPGFSPATYEPTPRQITDLSASDLYIRAGVPFEDAWIPRFQTANPDMPILDTRAGAAGEVGISQGHGPHADHDPHVWTDPRLAGEIALAIRDALISLSPADRVLFEAGFEELSAELDALDRDIRETLADLPNRRFMVYHPAWGHFAERYGLVQISIERDGKEPGARALAELIDEARREGIQVVFVQPQFDRRLAARVASELGGRVEVLDPLSPDYAANLREVARRIAQASDGTKSR